MSARVDLAVQKFLDVRTYEEMARKAKNEASDLLLEMTKEQFEEYVDRTEKLRKINAKLTAMNTTTRKIKIDPKLLLCWNYAVRVYKLEEDRRLYYHLTGLLSNSGLDSPHEIARGC